MAAQQPSTTCPPGGRRLVLCFDGTGNKFTGNESDSNIVKIYEMLNRKANDQYHYYQPGIGTYVENQISNSSTGGLLSQIKSSITTTVDQAVGTSFVHHVIAGYQFVMRFYNPGDKIYIFGFSRGAYTARFLAEMLSNLGLLSRGNEEMVKFAWSTFSDYQRYKGEDPAFLDFMEKFSSTFCTAKIKIHFLGLFDCVNSVGQFESPMYSKSAPYTPSPPAKHIRHAVSIHERRVKFKPALFLLEPGKKKKSTDADIKEVWFAGNHGDVGGGWHCNGDDFLLSEIPLKWMVDEVLALPEGDDALEWQNVKVAHAAKHESGIEQTILALPTEAAKYKAPRIKKMKKLVHDVLAFGGGLSTLAVCGWWILESLPFLTRLELQVEDGQWVPQSWPPNFGATRDIPVGSEIHPSVQQMRRAGILSENQMPRFGGDGKSLSLTQRFIGLFRRKEVPSPVREHFGDPELDDDSDDSDSSDATAVERSWENLGRYNAKSWNWEAN